MRCRGKMSKSYYEKLKDPRWQKKRLEIFERDEFLCCCCFSEDKTLSVHHGYYEFGKEPWEHENETMYTLCEDCHRGVRAMHKAMKAALGAFSPHDYSDHLLILDATTRMTPGDLSFLAESLQNLT